MAIKRITHHNKLGLILGMQDWFDIQNSINIIHPINTLTKKKYTVIRVDAEKKH